MNPNIKDAYIEHEDVVTVARDPQFWQQASSVADWLEENAEHFAWTYKGSTAVRRLIQHIDQDEAETIVHRLPAMLPVRPTEGEVRDWFATLNADQRDAIYWGLFMNGQMSIADEDDVEDLADFVRCHKHLN